MAPSGVNNVLRAHQGAIKRWYEWTIPKTTTGTAGSYLLAYTVPATVLNDGDCHTVAFHAANTAGATLNVGGLGAVPLHYYAAALIGVDQILRVAYHSSSAAYRLIDLPDRTGEVVSFAGGTAPAGSLLCFGQAVSRTAYAGLFAAISTTHGVGDGSATFNLPDLRGRVAAGLGNMGGTESGRLNTYVASVLGAAGGAQNVQYAIGQIFCRVGSWSSPPSAFIGSTSGSQYVDIYSGIPASGASYFQAGGGEGINHGHGHPVQGWTRGDALNLAMFGAFGFTDVGATNSGTNVQPTMELNYIIRI
jgi:microcystin-dependent protein